MTNNNNRFLRLEITESISKLEINDIVLDRGIFQFIFNDKDMCPIYVQQNKHLIQQLCKDIRNKLSKKLKSRSNDPQLIEQGLSDIEKQIIEDRDKISVILTEYNHNSTSDNESNSKFFEEVKTLRYQFKGSLDPYNEWQLKVAEKYENLEMIFKSHYPEAWIFMEFCLSIKSILNVMDFTLPFMGVLVAAHLL